MTTEKETPTTALTATDSEKFTNMVIAEFSATVSDGMQMEPHQRKLAQHIFVKIDAVLKELEAKRASSGQTQKQPIVWANVNLNKLALDAIHRIDLGLDALIPNHIHPIPYLNGKTQKYDLDLRIGYVGKDFYRRKVAIDPPDFPPIYELVHENDHFKVLKKSSTREVETYEFEITNPFDRGEVIGGFGYLAFKEPKKNMLILVTPKQFKRSEDAARTKDFWQKDREAMLLKTVVHRVTDKMAIDPLKATASMFIVEAEEGEAEFEGEVKERANVKVIEAEFKIIEEPAAAGPETTGQPPDQQPETTGQPPATAQPVDDGTPDWARDR